MKEIKHFLQAKLESALSIKHYAFPLALLATLAACHESLEDRAAREAAEYTKKNCPTPVVQQTRTDSLTFDKATRTIGYWYTLCGSADNAEQINTQQEKLRGILLDGLKGSTQLKIYKDAGFNVRYVYHSEKDPKTVLLDYTFSRKDYQ